jgi:membrane associated rhomboid family serine protease
MLLAWIGLNDVLPTVLGIHDHTAHWAHLGGFLCGMALALILLLTRQVDANGGDILSVTLGPAAWKIIGTPADRTRAQAV